MFELLKKNDKVGLITPASFITEDKLQNAISNLKSFGLEPFYYDSIMDKYAYFAGTFEQRAEEINKMYANKSVKAIICVRGGYGTSALSVFLDYETIKKNPKPLIGYSDITALLTAIYLKTKQIAFHGPVGASKFNDFTANNFYNTFFKKNELIKIESLKDTDNFIINSGKVEGKLIGGNLAVLTSLLATPLDVSWENKIVFIEEINEPPYKIDRMLSQLIQANKFKNVTGIIFGKFNKCSLADFSISSEDSFTTKEVIMNLIKPLNIPAIYGFPFGHIDNQVILPIGANASFDADKMELTIKKIFLDFRS